MHELIKIENTPSGPSLRDTTIGSESVPAVNARELHEFLGVNTKFNTWIKRRIEECRLLENRDYIWVSQNWTTQTSQGKLGVATQKVVILSLDAAKHIAMIERTDKGFEVRDYFIECEKKLKQVMTTEHQLILNTVLATTVEERMLAMGEYRTVIVQPLLEFKEQALPKVSYYDNVLNSSDLVTITQIAKERPRRAPLSSKQSFFAEHYGMTAIDFNKLLESLHIQSRQWLLYHHYANTQSSTFVTEYGSSKLTTKWTQKGRLFIYEKLKGEGILPICERPEGDLSKEKLCMN